MQDDNYVYVLLGERPDGSVAPIKVTSGGELIVEFVANGAHGTQTPKIDANYVTVNMAEYDGQAVSLLTDEDGRVVISGLSI